MLTVNFNQRGAGQRFQSLSVQENNVGTGTGHFSVLALLF